MKKNLGWILIAPLAAAWLASCSSSPAVNIGDPVGDALTDYAGGWDGYAEAYQFSDHSDRIRLVLDDHGAGTLRVGDAALFSAASNPDVGYPPGTTLDKYYDFSSGGFVPGFDFPVHGTHLQDSRIQLGVDPKDVYVGWCALQTPVLDETNGGYGCVANWGATMAGDGSACSQTNPATQMSVDVDCGKLILCQRARVCICTASTCAADVSTGNFPVQLDAALTPDGSQLTGTLVVGGQRVTIRMHR